MSDVSYPHEAVTNVTDTPEAANDNMPVAEQLRSLEGQLHERVPDSSRDELTEAFGQLRDILTGDPSQSSKAIEELRAMIENSAQTVLEEPTEPRTIAVQPSSEEKPAVRDTTPIRRSVIPDAGAMSGKRVSGSREPSFSAVPTGNKDAITEPVGQAIPEREPAPREQPPIESIPRPSSSEQHVQELRAEDIRAGFEMLKRDVTPEGLAAVPDLFAFEDALQKLETLERDSAAPVPEQNTQEMVGFGRVYSTEDKSEEEAQQREALKHAQEDVRRLRDSVFTTLRSLQVPETPTQPPQQRPPSQEVVPAAATLQQPDIIQPESPMPHANLVQPQGAPQYTVPQRESVTITEFHNRIDQKLAQDLAQVLPSGMFSKSGLESRTWKKFRNRNAQELISGKIGGPSTRVDGFRKWLEHFVRSPLLNQMLADPNTTVESYARTAIEHALSQQLHIRTTQEQNERDKLPQWKQQLGHQDSRGRWVTTS